MSGMNWERSRRERQMREPRERAPQASTYEQRRVIRRMREERGLSHIGIDPLYFTLDEASEEIEKLKRIPRRPRRA